VRGFTLVLAVVCACGSRTELDALHGADAAADTPVTATDFVWWKLDETSGTIAHDSSTHHYDVTIEGLAWEAPGALFDGATCGSVEVDPRYRDPPITITAWLTPLARSDQAINAYGLLPFPPNAVSGDTPGAGGYGIGADVWSPGGPTVSAETGVGVETGFHTFAMPSSASASFIAVVATSASAATVYVDGAVLANTSANDAPTVDPPRFHLGCHNDDTGYGSKRFFRGRMRDARIYDRALAASEIAALHAAGPAP
jgi:hypothetical protein